METKIADLKVRHVGLAARCEVCHQDDLFNPKTSECARCQDTLVTFQTGLQPLAMVMEPVSPESISPVGRELATVSAAISLLFAVPGLLAFLQFFYLVFFGLIALPRDPTGTPIQLFGFILLGAILPVCGFFLFFWYWKIALKPTLRRTRNRVWTFSTIFNGLLLMSAFRNHNSLKEIDDSLILTWFIFVVLIMLVSAIALIEEVFRGRSANAD